MNITALRQKKADALAKARAIDKLAESQNRILTEQETLDFNAAMAEAKSFDAPIAAKEALLEAERTAPAVTVAAVGHNNREDEPWPSLGAQLSALRAATINPRTADVRIQAALGSSEGVASDGGVLVDPQFAPGILQRTYEESILANDCMEMPMSSASIKIKAVDEKSRVNGSRFGGIQGFWEGEADLYQASKPKFRTMDVNAHKLTALIFQTEEEIADIPFLTAYQNETVPQELAFKIDAAIPAGSGAGMPLGFQNSPAMIVVPKETNQPAGTVTTNNILAMLSRLYPRSLKTAKFYVNPAIIWTQLTYLTIGSGTAVKLIYQGPSAEAPYGSIFGVPVVPIEQAAAVGVQGDIVLADLKTYMLARRQGIRADSSIHVAFLTGEVAFRWMMRLDGQPTWNLPLTPFSGNVTTSPYVALAARS